VRNALGIDVSSVNGPIDWHAHRDIAFAAVKCIEGPHGRERMFYDPAFAENWHAMREVYANKLVRFAYCFAHPSHDPHEQADALTSVTQDHGLQPGDHFWLDLEHYPGLTTPDGMPAREVAAWARKFCERVNRNCPDHRCMVYCNPQTAEAGCCEGLGGWRLAVGDWEVPRPRVPRPWRTWHIWQYSGSGLDRDVYNGDRDSLLTFARMPANRR
jgi:GH25 family lysozyme M1 (1,4-beta-N-acetylmuramidase)